jgi:hypothetical protein
MIQKAVKSLIRIGMSNILNVKIICLVWFLLFRKCNSLREVAGGMLGLSGKEETVRINHLPKEHFVGRKQM